MKACSSSGDVFRIRAAGDELPAHLADHAAGCSECRTALQRAEQFDAELYAGAEQLAAREMPNLLTGELAQPTHRSGGWLPAVTTVAVAVVLAFIVIAGYDGLWGNGPQRPSPSQPALATQPAEGSACPATFEEAEAAFDTDDGDVFVATGTIVRFVDSPDADFRGYEVDIERHEGPIFVDGTVLLRVEDPIAGMRTGQAVLVLGERTERRNLILPGECAPLQPIAGVPEPSPSSPATVLSAGTAALADGIPVYAQPGAAEPFTVLEGQTIYVRGQDASDDRARWQEVQMPYGVDWVFGWVPLDEAGVPPLVPLDGRPCPTPEEFAGGLIADTPARPDCMRDGPWSVSGYLIRDDRLSPEWPYEGEPAWLVGPPEYHLTGAIGPAVTSWQVPLHFDPAFGVEVDPSWLNDREGFGGLRVTVSVQVRHEASGSCALTARDPALADPTPLQAMGWCQQRVVVTGMQPGFAEPPAERIDGVLVECENPVDGYVVEMPSDWFTNADGALGACSLFSPVAPPATQDSSADEAAIQLSLLEGSFGFIEEPDYVAWEQMVWGGRTVTRDEVRNGDGSLEYRYIINLGGEGEEGPTLIATTSDTNPGDYETNKAVLDVMVRNFNLSGPSKGE